MIDSTTFADTMSRHGVEAAATTGLVRHTIRSAAMSGVMPSAVLAHLNAMLLRADGERAVVDDDRVPISPRFCTVLVGAVQPTDQGVDIILCSGGHPLPLVSRAVGTAATAAAGAEFGLYGSSKPVISADGRYVAYYSYGTDLVAGFVNANGGIIPGTGVSSGTDVFLYDRLTGTNRLVSHQAGAAHVGGNYTSGSYDGTWHRRMAISDDGRYLAYVSQATDLVANFVDGNGHTPAESGGGPAHLPSVPLCGYSRRRQGSIFRQTRKALPTRWFRALPVLR